MFLHLKLNSSIKNCVNRVLGVHKMTQIKILFKNYLGPVVQSIVSLTMSLRRQLVKYMLTTYANTSLFLLKNVRIFCTAKDSHIFPTKNNSIFVIFMFSILTKR